MFLFKDILKALTFMGCVNAAVPIIRNSPEGRAVAPTQSCHVTDHGVWVGSYSVLIEVPYGGPQDCDDTYHALEDATGTISEWQCLDSDGNIQLYFNVWYGDGVGDEINGALSRRYPTVDEFNCPDR